MKVPHDRLVEGATPREVVAGGGLVVWVFWVVAFVSASTTIALAIPRSISILRAPAGRQRRHTLIITALPVLFAVTSTVACVFIRATLVMECIQHVAEAFALHSLMKLIIARMGGPVRAAEHLEAQGPHRYLQVPPFCCIFFCLPKIVFGHRVVRLIRMTTRQFMILVPIFSVLLVIVGYCWPSEHPWLISALRLGMFLSALTALYGLFVMWSATRLELSHYHTTAKFAVIKLIILISLVQRYVLMILASNGVIRGDNLYTASAKATLYQNVLLSAESPILYAMVLYAYPASELRDVKNNEGDGLKRQEQKLGPDETATEVSRLTMYGGSRSVNHVP